MGERALPRLLEQIDSHEREMAAPACTLFSRWLEQVVGHLNPRLSTRR
jgi:hypothetical protein